MHCHIRTLSQTQTHTLSLSHTNTCTHTLSLSLEMDGEETARKKDTERERETDRHILTQHGGGGGRVYDGMSILQYWVIHELLTNSFYRTDENITFYLNVANLF